MISEINGHILFLALAWETNSFSWIFAVNSIDRYKMDYFLIGNTCIMHWYCFNSKNRRCVHCGFGCAVFIGCIACLLMWFVIRIICFNED